jgi:predicted dehydrogenase
VCQALEAGKHVFVEKPLAVHQDELEEIEQTYKRLLDKGEAPLLMVGFNRRFAPQIEEMKRLLAAKREPKTFIMTVNAGEIPPDHWTQDSDIGGGRIIGEGCHFIDLLRFLTGSAIERVQAMTVGDVPSVAVVEDKMTLTMSFADGSMGTVHYFANGDKSFAKERLEVFCGGGILQLDNFRKLNGYGWTGFKSSKLWSQDKGNAACMKAFVRAVEEGRPSPIGFDELVEVTRASFQAATSHP